MEIPRVPRLLPSPPQTQARACGTFSPPPIDGSLRLPELFEWHAQHNPNHRLFTYANDEAAVRNIYWPEAVHAIHVGAQIVRDRMGWKPNLQEIPVVAILSASDTISYFTMLMSIMRANYTAFPISPRNSAAAVAYLISKVGVKHVLVGQEIAIINLANDAMEIVEKQYFTTGKPVKPDLSPVPLFQDLFLGPSKTSMLSEDLPFDHGDPDTVVMILHSSGSTAFPKPIEWTNHRFAQLALIPWFGERDLTGQVFSLHTMPMYHGMGVLQLCWTASSGLVVGAFEPKSPAQVPTPDGLFKAAKATGSDIVFCVPAFVEAWSRNPDYVNWLASRGGVLYGGGPLNKEVGDHMTSQGVSIFILYGSTEGGIMSPLLPAEVGYDWDYFRFPLLVTPHMVPQGNNAFELVMVSNQFCRPSVINTKIDGVDAYATSDLMTPHPTKAGYYRVHGRTDDQIMHNTGEKTNPGPLENMLNQDPHILASVMFGRGKFQAGVIVDPRPDFKFDPSDEGKLAEFRNKIWPTIERMNDFAPQHSRLFKEMIIVAKPSKPFTYTAKSTVRRQAIIIDYEYEIETLYKVVDESTQSSIPPPSNWDLISTTKFVRQVVQKVLAHATILDDDDVFQHGCDSLQATWIRNSLLRALRDSAKIDTRQTISNFVYNHSSISRLAVFISSLASGTKDTVTDISYAGKANAMRAMAVEYSHDFPSHKAETSLPVSSGDVVLVTGTTGALGCYILDRLFSDTAIARIYAINRPSRGKSLPERQELALVARGLESGLLGSAKVVLVEGDLSATRFSLSGTIYEEMRRSVTHIIHNAWPVDFNLALTSFESNVKGLRNLVDFALTSALLDPPRFVYTSTIGVFQNPQVKEPLPECAIGAEVAVGTGYTESKWVSEQILSNVASKTSLHTMIVRVGQLSGGSNGAWNVNEWVPSLVQSATSVGCLPDETKDVSWIPLRLAADALVDFRKAPSTTQFLHLVHPCPIRWSTLVASLSSELSVSTATYSDWLAKLEQKAKPVSVNDEARNGQEEVERLKEVRALRLLPFFRGILRNGHKGNAFGFPRLEVTNAVSCSPTLANPKLPQLGEDDVKKWVKYWRSVGLLNPSKV